MFVITNELYVERKQKYPDSKFEKLAKRVVGVARVFSAKLLCDILKVTKTYFVYFAIGNSNSVMALLWREMNQRCVCFFLNKKTSEGVMERSREYTNRVVIWNLFNFLWKRLHSVSIALFRLNRAEKRIVFVATEAHFHNVLFLIST